jgi:energy-coupling factor transport system substrate-specific component
MNEMQVRRLSIRDVMTVAAMLVINYIVTMIIGAITLPFPFVYLYGSAGIDAFFGATFYLVAANRVNKHGLLFIWATIFGLIQAVMGYAFLLPYFLVVGTIAELSMIGKNTYRNPVRNMIGWGLNSVGNIIGCAVPLWWAWDSYEEMALSGGFPVDTLNMQLAMATNPGLMLVGVLVTVVLSSLGVMFGQRLLRKHFKKAGIVG